eukprot:3854543-Amphidinium_carterae.1
MQKKGSWDERYEREVILSGKKLGSNTKLQRTKAAPSLNQSKQQTSSLIGDCSEIAQSQPPVALTGPGGCSGALPPLAAT